MISPSLIAHSTQVQIHLKVERIRLPIAQLGPDFVIMSETATSRSRRGEIAVRIDSTEKRWTIELPEGLAAAGQHTRIVNLS